MDAVADSTAEVILTNVVSKPKKTSASNYILNNRKQDDIFKTGPLRCDFTPEYLRAVQKVTKDNTERLNYLLEQQNKYLQKKGIRDPCAPRSPKEPEDDDKENHFTEMVERTETEKNDGKPKELEKCDSVNGRSPPQGSEKVVELFGWDSDEEEKAGEIRPARLSIDRETTTNMEMNLPVQSQQDSDKEKEYVSIYSSELEDSELPCTSKEGDSSSVSRESPVPFRGFAGNVRSYSRKKSAPETDKSLEGNPEEPEKEPFFVISSVTGNADFDCFESAEISENEKTDESQSAITPKKTDDITKIKGWRKKQFARSLGLTDEFPEERRPEPPRIPILHEVVIKKEPPDEVTDSAFVCDSLDDFLDKEADLKVNYEIPHLYAEVGIKLTSDEIVSRPKISDPVPYGGREFPAERRFKKRKLEDDESGRRTDNKKIKEKCIKNLIDHRYHYVSSGGKLLKVAGSYDTNTKPTKPSEVKPGKIAMWGNKTKSFDDIFDDLMHEDEVKEERPVDKSVVLLHRKRTVNESPTWQKPETPQKSPVEEKVVETVQEVKPLLLEPEISAEEKIPWKPGQVKLKSKLVGMTVYPAPYRPLPSVVQYHLRKIRSFNTKIDRNWANFAVSALDHNRDPKKRARMIIPVLCPVLEIEKPSKDYASYCKRVLDPFCDSSYFKNFDNKFQKVQVPVAIRDTVENIIAKVEESEEQRSRFGKKRKGKNKAKINSNQIITTEEKRTRKLPGRYKDTTILGERIMPLSFRACDFSSPSVVVTPEPPKKTINRRSHEKLKELKRLHGIKECKVVMHRMKGLTRVAPWCMKHACYNCQPCRLRNPLSSKFFKMQTTAKRRPSSSWSGTKSFVALRNVAVKKTGPRSVYGPRPDVYPVPIPDENGDIGKNFPLPFKKIFSEKSEERAKSLTLENVFEEDGRKIETGRKVSLLQSTFNKVVAKLVSEKLKDLKSPKNITGTMETLRHLRSNVIELIKLNLVKESFNTGYINIWYLRGKTQSKSRAFLTFSKYPPVDDAVNLKLCDFYAKDLPKVITEIVSEEGRFDSDDYAILHCDGALWEIHGSVNFTVEKNEELERPIEEIKRIYAEEVIVKELRFKSRLHPGKVFDNPAKWWIMDLSQEYLEILTKVDNKVYKFSRDDINKYTESKVSRFVNIGRSGSPVFGMYIIPSILPYGLIGPYHLHESHGLELKIYKKSVPFTYRLPGSSSFSPEVTEPPEQSDGFFGLKHLIRQTVEDFGANHREVFGMWLHDKTMKKEPSFLEVSTRLKKMPPPVVPKKKFGYDFSMEHDYSLSLRKMEFEYEALRETSTSSRTAGIDQCRNRNGRSNEDIEVDESEFSVYLVSDIPNLGYVKGQLMSDHSITIRHPLNTSRQINSLKMDEWLTNFLRQKIQFIPKDLKIKWRTATDIQNVGDEKPLNKFALGGTHILCQKGLFYMLSMNKTILDSLGLDKADVLKAISESTIIKEVMEVKELGKVVTMESECILSIYEVLQLAMKEIKGLELKGEELVKIKAATEKKKWKLCRQYMDTLKSCSVNAEVKKRLFSNVKRQLLAIQEERRKSDHKQAQAKVPKKPCRPTPPPSPPRLPPPSPIRIKQEPEDDVEIIIADSSPKPVSRSPKKVEIKRSEKSEPKRALVSVLDVSKINKKSAEAEEKLETASAAVEETISITEEDDEEEDGFGIKIVDVQSMAAPEPEPEPEIMPVSRPEPPTEEIPNVVATEEIVSTPELSYLRDSDIKKLEYKLANIYNLLRSKTRPEDTVEYKRLLMRLTTISRQLDRIKGVFGGESGPPQGPPPPPRPPVLRPIAPVQPMRSTQPARPPPPPPPPVRQIQPVRPVGPLYLTNPMNPGQPIFLIVDSSVPSAPPVVASEPTTPEIVEEDFPEKVKTPLENAIVNGNQKFRIERKLEKATGKEPEAHYVVHKPYYPPDPKPRSESLEPNVTIFVDNNYPVPETNVLPTISNVRSLRKPSEEELSDFSKFTMAKKDDQKSSQEGFIPLTSLNFSKNLTVRRRDASGSNVEIFPIGQGSKPKSKPVAILPKPQLPNILKSVLIRRPQKISEPVPATSYIFSDLNSEADTDSGESWGRSETGLEEDSDSVSGSGSRIIINITTEEEKKRRTITASAAPSKKPRRNPDSDEETSWLTMNTEDIEKNFTKLIEPIIQCDTVDGSDKP